jgi:hypothetical protein
MGELNVPRNEAEALKALDNKLLASLMDQSIREEHANALRHLRLDSCGPYVGTQLRAFERALSAHAAAKSPKKRAETDRDVRKTRSDLEHAVLQMQARVTEEEAEGQLFFIEDHVMPPITFSERLRVPIRYRWRDGIADEWKYSSTTFVHKFVPQPDYITPSPVRKPSNARQELDRQEALYRQWEYLRMLSLHAIRDHFRQGGAGDTIPEMVQAKADPHTHSLNNFSARFEQQSAQ